MDGNYSAEFKAKVAMEAIRGDLTLAELAAKHGIHHTMIGAWKRQAMDGMASLFDMAIGARRLPVRRKSRSCTPRSGNWWWSAIFWRKPPVDERDLEAVEDRAGHQHLSIVTQCRLLSISRSSYYYTPVPETDETLALMTVIDETFMECPWYGSRQMARHLRRLGHAIGRRRVRRLMAKMGLTAIYQRPRTSDPHPEHRIYPYLLRDLEITRPNHTGART